MGHSRFSGRMGGLLCGMVLLLTRLGTGAPPPAPAVPTAADYPGAAAVWTQRELEITVAATGATTVRDHRRLTVLTPQGLGQAHWELPYDRASETLELCRALTHRDGQRFPLDPATVREAPLYPGVGWYDSLVMRRFTLPAASVGATFEVETLIHRPRPRLAGSFATRLSIQQGFPVHACQVTIHLPLTLPLTTRFTPPLAPEATERVDGAVRTYCWTFARVPALAITDPQTPPPADLVGSARLTTLGAWAPVARWYATLTADKDALTPTLRHLAEEQTVTCPTPERKLAALHRLVRRLPFVAVEMGQMSDEPHSADAVWQAQLGDCKDKATLLKALLRAVQIPSYYVLVRTTDAGALDSTLYGPDEFNHVLLAVPLADGLHYLDATIAEIPATALPRTVEGAPGLLIRDDGTLVTLPVSPAAANHTQARVTVTVAGDGSATGRVHLTYTGQTAIAQRSALTPVPPARYCDALQAVLAPRLGSEVTLDTVTVQALADPERPLVLEATFSSPAYLQPAVDPLLLGQLPALMYQTNPFRTARTRTHPLHRRLASSLTLDTAITLPPGFTLAQAPPPVDYAGPFGDYRESTRLDGTTLHYTCTLAARQGLWPASSLPDARAWASLLALEGNRSGLQFFVRRPDAAP
jgi:hypothetical protein